MSEWTKESLGSLVTFQKGRKVETSDFQKAGFTPYLGAGSLTGENDNYADTAFAIKANENDILMLWDGERSGLVGHKLNGVVSSTVSKLTPNTKIGSDYLYYYLLFNFDWIQGRRTGTGVPHVPKDLARILEVSYPECKRIQFKISSILSAIDRAIEKTESLIAKYQKIKAGLMHDLFTRGVTADGKLRPPREQAPELYHETPVGWIPVEWEFDSINSIMESLIDGPFGSNLKTEHYVTDPGVRVVRLQNIQATRYNDNDRAYVSDKHAAFLFRHKVLSGDILIAGLGEDRYPVGRACLYPDNLPPAINKADCFRLRCKVDEAENTFVMLYLNTEPARVQIRKYEQGVTRPRINSGNFKKLIIPKPSIEEQKIIAGQIMKVAEKIEVEKKRKHKFIMEKSGLMQDLLTGKVPVKVDEPGKEFA